jgi:hypothetical protein
VFGGAYDPTGATGTAGVCEAVASGPGKAEVTEGSSDAWSKPHSRQKRASGSNVVPHWGQNFMANKIYTVWGEE